MYLAIRSLYYSPQGDFLLSAADDGRVMIWNMHSMQLELCFSHTAGVRTARFTQVEDISQVVAETESSVSGMLIKAVQRLGNVSRH